ncbi:MAG: DUF3073 domain-containing protein [Mycobacteriaceae bacterium]
MGRGRAKAKQTKVARELKYSSPSTDFSTLQRELSGHPEPSRPVVEEPRSRWDVDDDDADEVYRA